MSTQRQSGGASSAPIATSLEKEWKLVWRTATPDSLGDLQKVTIQGGVQSVEEATNKHFDDGFKKGRYKFWYFHSKGDTFIKVIVSEERPNYDMVLTGDWPALGMVMFRAEDSDFAKICIDLEEQIEEKGESQRNRSLY